MSEPLRIVVEAGMDLPQNGGHPESVHRGGEAPLFIALGFERPVVAHASPASRSIGSTSPAGSPSSTAAICPATEAAAWRSGSFARCA